MSEIKPIRELWIAVLFRALSDAAPAMGVTPRKVETREWLDRYHARDWILSCGPDFREVCSMAGFRPEQVIEALQSGRALAVIRNRNRYAPVGVASQNETV